MHRKSNVYLPGCAKMVDNYIWISVLEFNSLIKIDVNTGYLSFVGRFPAEDADYQLYSQICNFNNKLVFLPWNTNCITVYDMKTHDFRKISMKRYNYSGTGRFLSAIQENERLYFISENAKEIVEFDMQKEIIKDVYEQSEKGHTEDFFGYVMPLRTQNDIWKISEKRGQTWKFNIISKSYEETELFNRDMTIYTGCSSEEYIWLLAESSILYQFTSDGKHYMEYDLSEVLNCKLSGNGEERDFFSSIYLQDYLFFIWYRKKCIVRMAVKDSIVQVKEYQINNYDRADFSFGDRLILIEYNRVTIFEGENKRVVTVGNFYGFMKDIVKAMDNKLLEKSSSCMELENYISFLNYHPDPFAYGNVECTAGSRIHRMMI